MRTFVGKSLRAHRLKIGMTQEEVAHGAHTNPSHLGRIERGEDNPTIDSVERIICAMHADPKEVFGL